MFNNFTKSKLGMTLVGVGLAFLLFRMADISLSNFWPLILVAFGMYQLRSGGDQKQAKTFMAVGGVLLAFTLNLFGLIATIWPLAFVLAGLYFLTKNNNSEASNNISGAFETAARGASRGFRVISRTIQDTFLGGSSRSSSSNYANSESAQNAHFQTVNSDGSAGSDSSDTTRTLTSENSGKKFTDPAVSSTVMFSSSKLVPSVIKSGGSSTCLFGDLKIDLRDVQDAPENVNLDVTCGFGDVDIMVPQDWRVELKSSSFFADVSNETRTSEPVKTTLQVNANCFFGDIDISN